MPQVINIYLRRTIMNYLLNRIKKKRYRKNAKNVKKNSSVHFESVFLKIREIEIW